MGKNKHINEAIAQKMLPTIKKSAVIVRYSKRTETNGKPAEHITAAKEHMILFMPKLLYFAAFSGDCMTSICFCLIRFSLRKRPLFLRATFLPSSDIITQNSCVCNKTVFIDAFDKTNISIYNKTKSR